LIAKLQNYWKYSRSPLYSLLFVIPLLFVYELMIFSLNHSDIIGIRNGADVLFRQFFSIFDIYGFYLVGFLVLLSLFIAYYFYSRKEQQGKFQFLYFIIMMFESIFYAMLLFLVLNKIAGFLLVTGNGSDQRQIIALALGAGVYEEFVFRVIMISAIVFLMKDLIGFSKNISRIVAIIFSALIFSWFHYIGSFGEEINLFSFTVRSAAGIFLAILYLFRGYGITAYTHTLYDLLVIL